MADVSKNATGTGARLLNIRTLLPALPILLVTLLMGLLAWRVSADERVLFGAEADPIYLVDGFYDPERSDEHGTYRWTQPLAQLRMPNWGPGRIHLIAEGVSGAGGRVALTSASGVIAETEASPGQPWTLQGWLDSTEQTPIFALEGQPYTPPGEGRDLSLLVKSVEIYAPDARLRAALNIALLGLSGLLLYALLLISTGRTTFAAIVGTALPALFGPLAAFRDPWLATIAWAAPLSVIIALAVQWRGMPRVPTAKPEPDSPRPTPGAWRYLPPTIALTAALLLLYYGVMNAFDADRMYDMSAGLAEYGRPTRYPGLETYTKYGFGQSLIAVPFYLLGKLLSLFGGDLEALTRLTVSFTNLAVTALTLVLLYHASRRFAGTGISLAIAATYLLSTPALNYGRTFFSEPAGGLLLLAAILLVLPQPDNLQSATDPPNDTGSAFTPQRALLAGICLGAMLLFKPAFVIYWVPVGLLVVWLTIRDARSSRAGAFRTSIVRMLAFGAGPLIALFLQGWYNYIRYSPLPDAVFRMGYEREAGFSTPLLEGLGGLLFSPGKSIFLYAPVVLLAPLGLWLLYRKWGSHGKLLALIIAAEILIGFVFNAAWWAWTGNFAWGPRLIIPLLPLLIWLLAPIFPQSTNQPTQATIQTTQRHQSKIPRAAWLLLAIIGALVNIPGAMVDFHVYYRSYGLLLAGQEGEAITIYDPANSPLLVEPRYLLDGLTAAIYRPSLASTGMPPIWDTLIPLTLVILSVAALLLTLRRRVKRAQQQSP